MKRVKARADDFVASYLPHSRKDGFFDLLKTHYQSLLLIGLVVLVGFLPLLASYAGRTLLVLSYLENGMDQGEASAMAHVLFGAIDIVGAFFLFFLLSGCVRVLRQLLYLEPIFFWADLKLGWKQNGLKFGLYGAFASLLYYFLGFLSNSLYGAILLGVLVVLILPCLLWCLAQNVCYAIPFGTTVRNAFVLYVKSIWASLLMTLLFFVVYEAIVSFVPFLLISLLVLLVFVFLAFPLILSAFLSLALGLFDEQINKKSFPELYRKGLYCEEED